MIESKESKDNKESKASKEDEHTYVLNEKVYAKSNNLRWKWSSSTKKFQMVQHRVHTFQWKMPISLDRKCDCNNNNNKMYRECCGITTVSGQELARLSHEIAWRLFTNNENDSTTPNNAVLPIKILRKIEIKANDDIQQQINDSFERAGRTYRTRGKDDWAHDDGLSENGLNDDEEEDIENNTKKKIFSDTEEQKNKRLEKDNQKKKNYRRAYNLGSQYDHQTTVFSTTSSKNEPILFSYYFEAPESNNNNNNNNNNNKKTSLSPSHIRFRQHNIRCNNKDDRVVLEVQVWEHQDNTDEGDDNVLESNVSNTPQLNLTIQKDLTRHIALSCFKSLYQEYDAKGRKTNLLQTHLHTNIDDSSKSESLIAKTVNTVTPAKYKNKNKTTPSSSAQKKGEGNNSTISSSHEFDMVYKLLEIILVKIFVLLPIAVVIQGIHVKLENHFSLWLLEIVWVCLMMITIVSFVQFLHFAIFQNPDYRCWTKIKKKENLKYIQNKGYKDFKIGLLEALLKIGKILYKQDARKLHGSKIKFNEYEKKLLESCRHLTNRSGHLQLDASRSVLMLRILDEWKTDKTQELTYQELTKKVTKLFDTNKDLKMFSDDEMHAICLDIDTNKDKKISVKEFSDYFNAGRLKGLIKGLAELINPKENHSQRTPGSKSKSLRTKTPYEMATNTPEQSWPYEMATNTPEQSWAKKYKSALQLYYNIGRKNWIQDIPISSMTTPSNSPNNSPNNSPTNASTKFTLSTKSINQFSIHPPSPVVLMFKLIKKTICCSCNKSKSGKQQKKQTAIIEHSLQPRLRRHHLLKKDVVEWVSDQQRRNALKNGEIDDPIEWDGWISDQQRIAPQKDLRKIGIASQPYSRYFYGKIIQMTKEEHAGSNIIRYNKHFGGLHFRPYCLVEFNDGVMTKHRMWISAARLRPFEKHYCYHRRIQHRHFFKEGQEIHRHFCYGSPPTKELGGGPELGSTLYHKMTATRSKEKNFLLGWMKRKSLTGKALWYSGCTQCEDCKEYFCRAHIQSHRIDSDKGCQKGFMNVKNEY